MGKAAEPLTAAVLRGHQSPTVLTDLELGTLYGDSVVAFLHSFNRLLRGQGSQEELGATHHVALIATRLWFDRCRQRKLLPPGSSAELRTEIQALVVELLESIAADQKTKGGGA